MRHGLQVFAAEATTTLALTGCLSLLERSSTRRSGHIDDRAPPAYTCPTACTDEHRATRPGLSRELRLAETVACREVAESPAAKLVAGDSAMAAATLTSRK